MSVFCINLFCAIFNNFSIFYNILQVLVTQPFLVNQNFRVTYCRVPNFNAGRDE